MKKKLLSLALALLLAVGCLTACQESDGGKGDGGDKNGDFANLDFKGETLTVSVSANADHEVTFSAADRYTKGPDNAATSEPVQKKVLARNKKVAEDLDVHLVYETTNLWYDEVLADVEKLVAGDAEDAPDVYNNDIHGLADAMLSGYLWNVTDPGRDKSGREVKSYFDFSHECWYKEYMEGASFSKEKLYLVVGDYNVDVIRFAWVFFVNIDLFDATFGSLSEEDGWAFHDYESLCQYVADTEDWYFDDMIALAAIGHNDAGGSTQGKTDRNDAQISVCLNRGSRLVALSSGVSIYEWTKNGKTVGPGEGTPSLISSEETDALVQLGNKYTELYNAKGILNVYEMGDPTIIFMEGKTVMAMVELGEMESEQMRSTAFKRGILPFPRYNRQNTDGVSTVVHDQAEVDVILNNASSFEMASAYLQYVNELSMPIMETYYEEVLKFKYNDSKGARDMIDLVHDSINTPFETVISSKIFIRSLGVTSQLASFFYEDAVAGRNSTFASSYAGFRDAVQLELEEMFASFEKLP